MGKEDQEKTLGELATLSQKVQSFMNYFIGRKK